jgi:mono/diheme cytochrome c family protein
MVGSTAVILISALAIAVATLAPFRGESADAAIRVVVDQEPNRGLIGAEQFVELVESVEVVVDGTSLGTIEVDRWADNAVALQTLSVEPGSHRVEVLARGATASDTLFDEVVGMAANEQVNIVVRSPKLAAVADEGREVFFARASGCSVCHSIEPGKDLVGPSLYGVATTAETRVPGLDARTYLWQSILLPDEYVVEGWPAGQMLPIYRDRLSQEELDALLVYMLTLTEDEDG